MRKYALCVIKEQDKYLQYYDTDWECYLFLNCAVQNGEDLSFIREKIYEKYHIKVKNIEYVDKRVHSKLSVQHNEIREYVHYFYKMDIEIMENDESYKWYTFSELKSDKRIQEVNNDIVDYVFLLSL